MKQTIKGFLAILISVTFAADVFAQVTTSSISGRVVDEKGEILAGAAVVAVHAPTGSQYYAVANDKGRFNINAMRSGGPYKVEISFLGMGTVVYDGIILSLGEPMSLDAVLKTSENLDAAVLTAQGSFSSNLTGAGSNYNLSTLESVPTIDRSVYDVVKLSPLVNQVGSGLTFTGTNNRYNNFMIDGAEANDSFGLTPSGTNGGMTGANPISMDALEEVQVAIAPFDVRQSGFTGGAINAVTKSGTNEIKGSAYSYFNNQDFIGVTPGKGVENRVRYQDQTSQVYGMTIGAPIIKDKLFVFVSAEYDRQSTPNIYTPLNGSYGDAFTADMAKQIMDHYSRNYVKEVSGYNENIDPHQMVSSSLNALARIDWNINRNNKLMFRYQFMNAESDSYKSSQKIYYFGNSGNKLNTTNNIAVLELNSRISDMVSNEFRASAVIVRDHRTVAYDGASVRIKGFDGMSDVYIGAEKSSGANAVKTDTYNISDNVSIFAGNHHVTVGTHNDFYKFNNLFLQNSFGGYEFKSMADFLDNKINKFQFSYADPTIEGVTDSRWAAYVYAARFGVYVQDEWTPSRDFKLTYGIRTDIPVMFNKPSVNDAFNATEQSKKSGEMIGVVPKASVLLSPRIGFRWFMDKAHKSLLRGGAGIFTGRVPFVWLANAYNNTGVETKSINISGDNTAGIPLTSTPYVDVVESGLLSGSAGTSVNTLNRNFRYPQTFRVNLGYEQDFGQGWNFVFDAVYSKSFNNVFFRNLALTTSDSRFYAVSADAASVNPASSAMSYYSAVAGYKEAIALENTNMGYSYSVSGQISKHFDFGLDLMASYTFGHSYSVNDGLSSKASSCWQTYVTTDSTRPELSYSYFDKPHKVMGTVSYTSPVYARMRTTVSLIYNGYSGNRYSYMSMEDADVNGDSVYGMLLYVPTAEEVSMMSWEGPADAAAFESFISGDKYLSGKRGSFTERLAGITPFENHFDLHVAQDFYYDRKGGRKIQAVVDFMNIGNLLNPSWGLVYDYSSDLYLYRQVLRITGNSKDASGNVTPTYKFSPLDKGIEDFASRWRCQIGLRVTF